MPSPYTLADAEEFIADSWRRLVAGERARLAIADAGGEKLLGSISLDLFADRQAAEIGYWIAREARRQGFALAAARLVVRWAFESRPRAPRDPHLPGQRRLAGPRAEARLPPRGRPARLPPRGAGQGPRRQGGLPAGEAAASCASARAGAALPPARRPGAVLAAPRRLGRVEPSRRSLRAAQAKTCARTKGAAGPRGPTAPSGLSPERPSPGPASRLDER